MKNKNNSLKILHHDFKKTYLSMSAKNWNEKISSYINKTYCFFGNDDEKRMVTGWVAGLCEQAYFIVAHKKNINVRYDFEIKISEIVNKIPKKHFLACSGPFVCGKHQPSFVESVFATLDRYQVIEQLPEVFGTNIDSIIIGGSMSYSPFFGVRENIKENDFSDIDAVIVVNDNFFVEKNWKLFMKTDIFPIEEKLIFLNRIKIFKKLLKDNLADVFSQKFSICKKNFIASIHFVAPLTFEKMVYTDLKKSLKERKDEEYVMRDFRTNVFRHPCHARHTFNGQRIETTIDGRFIDGGFISDMPGYIINDNKFYPGVYQTVISTSFLVFYDRNKETKKLVNKFEKILYSESNKMCKEFSSASYAKAHNRYDIFPPGRFEEGLNSYISMDDLKKYLASDNFSVASGGSEIIPGEKICTNKLQFKNNENIRIKSLLILKKWKNKTLLKAEKEIRDFVKGNNFGIVMSLAKKNKQQWVTVASIPCIKENVVKMKHPYLLTNSKHLVIREEEFVKIITPWEIMRLENYEKLSHKTGKVYVSSTFNKNSRYSNLPVSYEIIVPVIY